MSKIPQKYKAHIAHEIDRLEYIDKRNCYFQFIMSHI